MSDRQIPHDVAKLYTDFAELKTAVIGIDGNNGLKGDLKKTIELNHANITLVHGELKDVHSKVDRLINSLSAKIDQTDDRQDALELKLEQYLKYDRVTTCHGKVAVNNLKKEIATMTEAKEKMQFEQNKLLTEMAKARIAMWGTITVAIIYVVGQIVQRIIWG